MTSTAERAMERMGAIGRGKSLAQRLDEAVPPSVARDIANDYRGGPTTHAGTSPAVFDPSRAGAPALRGVNGWIDPSNTGLPEGTAHVERLTDEAAHQARLDRALEMIRAGQGDVVQRQVRGMIEGPATNAQGLRLAADIVATMKSWEAQ